MRSSHWLILRNSRRAWLLVTVYLVEGNTKRFLVLSALFVYFTMRKRTLYFLKKWFTMFSILSIKKANKALDICTSRGLFPMIRRGSV
jgi:hypothetical protein